jgi:hypothetical protein
MSGKGVKVCEHDRLIGSHKLQVCYSALGRDLVRVIIIAATNLVSKSLHY